MKRTAGLVFLAVLSVVVIGGSFGCPKDGEEVVAPGGDADAAAAGALRRQVMARVAYVHKLIGEGLLLAGAEIPLAEAEKTIAQADKYYNEGDMKKAEKKYKQAMKELDDIFYKYEVGPGRRKPR